MLINKYHAIIALRTTSRIIAYIVLIAHLAKDIAAVDIRCNTEINHPEMYFFISLILLNHHISINC